MTTVQDKRAERFIAGVIDFVESRPAGEVAAVLASLDDQEVCKLALHAFDGESLYRAAKRTLKRAAAFRLRFSPRAQLARTLVKGFESGQDPWPCIKDGAAMWRKANGEGTHGT